MSAIFGIRHSGGESPGLEELERLRAHLSRRGPDNWGIRRQAGIALGNCLLRTTPESGAERMPSCDEETGCWITADVRLDHRDELVAALGLPPEEYLAAPDSRLVLAAYRKWGEECPGHLCGDFAFAIWDEPRRRLFCARDHFGIKPFYYSQVGPRLAFCSYLDGLLQLDWIPRRLNERQVASHLTVFLGDVVETFFQDIVRLPAAHVLVVDARGTKVRRYWTLEAQETRGGSDEEQVEGFLEHFRTAVKSRLRADVKVGSMLSGGLDSSSISALAGTLLAESGRGRLATFSAVFDRVPRCNERDYIKAAIDRGGFDPSFLEADLCDPFLAPPEVEGTQADVQSAANLYLNWGLYGMARQRGVRVLLDGFDGDSTVSHGVAYLQELARANRWLELTSVTGAAARACHCSGLRLWWTYVWHLGLAPRIPGRVLRAGRGLARRYRGLRPGREEEPPAPLSRLNGAFAERLKVRQYQAARGETALVPSRTEREAHRRTLIWGVMPATLEMLSQAAAPFGIELRFPFWDRRLIEFCLGLPGRLKIRGRHTRWILRQAMEGILPPQVQWRPGKANIGYGFKHCLLTHGRKALDEAITAASERLQPYVCPARFEASLHRFRDRAGDDETLFIWQAANLARWMARTSVQA